MDTVKATDGIDIIGKDQMTDCHECAATKLTRNSFPNSTGITCKPLELIHSDVTGPLDVPTVIGHHTYAINFIDDYSRYTKVYLMDSKDQALSKFKQFIADLGLSDKHIGILRTDGGGEYINRYFEDFCLKKGIKMQRTIPYTPEQNGIAEKMWRTLFTIVRALLKESGAPPAWWGRALIHATRIQNRLIHSKKDKTPYELIYGVAPDLSKLRIFGSLAYYHPNQEKMKKLEDRGLPGIYVGHSETQKGYLIWSIDRKDIVVSRTTNFFENRRPFKCEIDIEETNTSSDEIDEQFANPKDFQLERGKKENINIVGNETNEHTLKTPENDTVSLGKAKDVNPEAGKPKR